MSQLILAALLAVAAPLCLAADIVIAQVAPFTGPLAPTGLHLRAGAQLYIDQINAKGGIQGKRLALVSRDDGYKAADTLSQTRALLAEAQPIALFGYVGTGNVEAILKDKLLEGHAIPLVTARTGANSIVAANNPWLFLTRASYAQEIEKIVQQYETIGYKRFALLYQNDPFGLDGAASAEVAIRQAGGQLVARASYEKNSTEVEAAAKAIAAASPQAVILIANTAASAAFLKRSRELGNLAQYVALSVTDGPQVVERIGASAAKGLAITQVVPDPASRATPMIREIQEAFEKFKPKGVTLNHTLVEGYLGAKILGEGLRRAGPNPSRQKLRDSLEQMRDYDIGGHYVGFSTTNHLGMNHVDITILNKDGRLLR